jgi:hypothetical protein
MLASPEQANEGRDRASIFIDRPGGSANEKAKVDISV